MPQVVRHGHSACSDARLAQSSAEGFTWDIQNICEAIAEHSQPLGRNEASMALATILESYQPQQFPFAVDITENAVFSCHRWFRIVVENRELISCGIVKAFAGCPTQSDNHQLTVCHPDGTYTATRPDGSHNTNNAMVGHMSQLFFEHLLQPRV